MVKLASISPDASPEEVAAIVAAIERGAGDRRRRPRRRRLVARVGAHGAAALAPRRSAARPVAHVRAHRSPRPPDASLAMTVAHAELLSVGPDEVVVTFTSDPDVRVVTRVGGQEVTTTGPFHTAAVRGLGPTPSTRSASRARSPTTGGSRPRPARSGNRPGGCCDDRDRERRALRRDGVRQDGRCRRRRHRARVARRARRTAVPRGDGGSRRRRDARARSRRRRGQG